MTKVAVFASGNGSNFEALLNFFKDHLHIDISLLVCDKPGAFAIQRAEQWKVSTFVLAPKDCASKQEYEDNILMELQKHDIDFIVLGGYMRLIGPTLLRAFMGRIVNIHPSLLPSFPGKDAIGQAFTSGVRVTGVTVHYVDEGMDTGPIIAQRAVEVDLNETKESLTQKIQAVEHQLYPRVIEACLTNQVRIEEGQVVWEQPLNVR